MRGKSKRGKSLIGAFTRARDGAVLVVVAVLLFVLAGAVALSVDLGRAWNLDTQLQDAADACALAAASQLDNTAGSRARAILACTDAADKLVANRQYFATDTGPGVITFNTNPNPLDNDGFKFYSDLGDPAVPRPAVLASGDQDADYVQVFVASREVGFYFAAAVGAVNSASPSATAVAGLTIAQCQSQPIMFCNPYDDTTNPPFDISDMSVNPPPDFHGVAIILDEGGDGAQWEPGNFGLLSVTNPGANALRDAIARVHPKEECFGKYVETKTGQVTSLSKGINVRFDIFEGGMKTERSDPEYVPARNTVKGLMKSSNMNKCDYTSGGTGGWVKGANPYDGTWDGSPATKPDVMGYPRDACLYSGACFMPGSPTYYPNPQDRFGDGDWAFDHYMAVNHDGMTLSQYENNGGGCGYDPDGNPISCGGDIPTRYEVYQWENKVGPPHTPWSDGPEAGAQGGQFCNIATPDPNPPNPDRRMLRVAVINCVSPVHDCDENGENCTTVRGNTKNVRLAEPDSWLHMFLLEPMGVYDSNNHVVAEVVAPEEGDFEDPTNKYIVQLYPTPFQ